MTNRSRMVSALSLVLACGACVSASADNVIGNDPRAQLEQLYPGVRFLVEGGSLTHVYGKPMTAGATPRAAAETWLAQHGAIINADTTTFTETWSSTTMNDKFTVFNFAQSIDGLPVEYGQAGIMVLNGPVNRVVMVSGTLAQRPAGGLPAATVDPAMAQQIVRAQPLYRALPTWTKPELVVWIDRTPEDGPKAITTWKFAGSGLVQGEEKAWTFFVNAQTGQLVHARSEIYFAGPGITGDVKANVTPFGPNNARADGPTNPPTLRGVGEIRVGFGSGGTTITDRSGLINFAPVGTGPFTATTTVNLTGGASPWVNVVPQGGVIPLSASVSGVTSPGSVNLLLNPAPAEALTAQINALVHVTLTHNFIRDRAPGFTALSIPIPANTGVTGTCNAFFSGTAITVNFYNSGGGCANTAYSSVVAHEYGHFIVNRRNLTQGSFGEGFGDSVSILLYDDEIIGRGFLTAQTPDYVRYPVQAGVIAPCSGGSSVHFCGQVYGAAWTRIRDNLKARLGSQPGLDRARDIFVAQYLITTGWNATSGTPSPAPANTAIEILTADDNDGNLENGTPNYADIKAALELTGLPVPQISPLLFTFSPSLPTQLVPGQPTSFPVVVSSNGATPASGSGKLFYRERGQATFTSVNMPEGSPNNYTAVLPATNCPTSLEFYFTALTSGGIETRSPAAANTFYSAPATAGASTTTTVDLNFNTDPGWTVTNDATLTTGAWERAVPNPANTFGAAPTVDADGSGSAWVTDNRNGTGSGSFDIDGGGTTLTSSAYDLSAFQAATVSYSRWLFGTAPDNLVAQVSNDNGATWVTLEDYQTSAAAWRPVSFRINDFVPLTSQMRFRFRATDVGTATVVEAGLDAFKIVGTTCPTTTSCYANCDNSTVSPVLNAGDFSCFLTRFRNGEAYANCDNSTVSPVLNAGDFSCFLTRFRAGCP